MSLAASAENTMNFIKVQNNSENNDNNDNNGNNGNNETIHQDDKIFFKETNDSDDDMVVIILEEDSSFHIQKSEDENENENQNVNMHISEMGINKQEEEENTVISEPEERKEKEEKSENENGNNCNHRVNKEEKNAFPKQKYIGIEVYTHFQHTMESKKMYPLLPCNMISSFAHAMEYVEYFDIPSEERKKLVIDLVKILAYSNNDYGSRECFEYFAEHNMVDDIMQTIIDGTKNRYDINRFPHTNRKFVLSCVSLSNKIKIVKPSAKIDSLFEEFKLNLCGLKRFFKMKEKDESKQT